MTSFVSYVRYSKMITKVFFDQEANKAQFLSFNKVYCGFLSNPNIAIASMDYKQSAALVYCVLRLLTSPLDTRVHLHSPR